MLRKTIVKMSKLRVFLADDHAVVREGLKNLINGHPGMTVIGEASDGRQACAQIMSLQPDMAVMDISMPLLNGIEATSQIKAVQPGTKILALTVHDDLSYLEKIIEAGASGYVLKTAAGQELIHAIEIVASGGEYFDPVITAKLIKKSVRERSENQKAGKISDREYSVLKLIAKGHTNKETGKQLNLSPKSVETYKARAMAKLGLRGRAEIVRYALEHAWLSTNDIEQPMLEE